MQYVLIYKNDNTTIKETFDFGTNPVYFCKFDLESTEQEISEETDQPEPIEDSMIFENEVFEHINNIVKQPDVLFFSIIEEKRKLYHNFKEFFEKSIAI